MRSKANLILIHVICAFLMCTPNLFSQLSGNKYIPGDYTTIGEAVDSLNLNGVGSGGVTFNIQAGHVESDPIASITATGTAGSPITFQKNGAGDNPLIIMQISHPMPTFGFNLMEFVGSDYVTIDGLTFKENPSNPNSPYSVSRGILFKGANSTDGCHYNEIKNCEFINCTKAVAFERDEANLVSGTNSFNKIHDNTINFDFSNITIYSFYTQSIFFENAVNNISELPDEGNKIGGNGGNTFNYNNNSGGSSSSPLTEAISVNSQKDLVISNNLINMVNYVGGFFVIHVFGVDFPQGSQSVPSGIIKIENNSFNYEDVNNNFYPFSSSIDLYPHRSAYDSVVIDHNYITGTNITTDLFRGIYASLSNNDFASVSNNQIINLSVYGQVLCIGTSQNSNGLCTIKDNEMSNVTVSSYDDLTGIRLVGKSVVEGNLLSNLSKTNSSGGGSIVGLKAILNIDSVFIKGNMLNQFSQLGGTGNTIGVLIQGSSIYEQIKDNTITELTGSNGNVYGINANSFSSNSTVRANIVHDLSSSGSVIGFSFNNQNSSGIRNILENEIYNLTSDSTVVALEVSGGENIVNENQLYALEVTELTSTGDLSGILFGKGNITLTNNTIQNFNHQGIGNLFGIEGTDTINLEIIQNNELHDFSSKGDLNGIFIGSHTENSTISDNQLYNLNGVGKLGGMYFANQNENGVRNITGNQIHNLESDSTIVLLEAKGGENTIENNAIYEASITNTFSQAELVGLLFSEGGFSIISNAIYNLSHQGSGSLVGVVGLDTNAMEYVENNLIHDLTSINIATGLKFESHGNQRFLTGNGIFNILGSQKAVGGYFSGANSDFKRNKIYNIESDGSQGESFGIVAENIDTVQISNNLLGNFFAPSSSSLNGVVGVKLDSIENAEVYYNSVFIDVENNSQNFGSSSIFIGQASENIDLRNNIFINTSQSNGSGLTVGLRMENDDLSVLSSDNDNNLYFVDTLMSNTAIYYDGTNTDVSLLAFQQRMDTREQNSFTQDVSFQSLNGSSIDFLRPDNAISTFVESNAQEISGYEDDYHFLSIRTGYPQTGQTNGGGEQPDIGAIEGDYIPAISSVGEEGLDDVEVTLFPNPTQDEFNIQFLNAKNSEHEITITDEKGSVLLNRTYNSDFIKINVREYASGVYFVRITNKNDSVQRRITVL